MTSADARKAGSFHLSETLSAFNAHISMGMNNLQLSEAGYLYNIRSRRGIGFTPPWVGREVSFGATAVLDDTWMHPAHILNTLLASPRSFGQLGDAFRRSSHWRELADSAGDQGESLLLHWMSAECLCKVRHDEEIASKLLGACGFPTGKLAMAIGLDVAQKLAHVEGYRITKKSLVDVFDALRLARNRIVHEGYRYVDLPDM